METPAMEATVTSQTVNQAKPRRLSERAAGSLAWSVWALGFTFGLASLLLYSVNRGHLPLIHPWFVPTFIIFLNVGATIAWRRPQNPIGWLFLTMSLALFGAFAEEYAVYTILTAPGSLPGGIIMAWLSKLTTSTGGFLAFTFTFLLFPTGRLPSRRWRPVAWVAASYIVLSDIALALRPGPMIEGAPASRNPLGIEQAAGLTSLFIDRLSVLMVLGIIVACAASLIERAYHARGEERQQLKWIAYVCGLLVTLFTLFGTLEWFLQLRNNLAAYQDLINVAAPLASLTVAAFPIAVGIAILRHHLFNIDIIINRTLVYVPLTGILAGLYSASIALLQKLFVAVTGEKSDAAIVLTTLILASTFTPIKNWLQTIVDRHFKEAPDAARRLKAFGEQVQADYSVLDPVKVMHRLLEEAAQAFEAQSGVLYLQRDGHMERAHTYGEWKDEDAEISMPIEYNGRQFGFIRLGVRKHGHEYTEKDREALRQVVGLMAEAIAPPTNNA